MAFVTFPSLNASKTVYEDHSTAFWSSCRPPMSSSDKWVVNFAPPPRDIYWENLADNRRWLWIKIFVSNLCLFLVALFLTTPEYIVSQLEPIILALTNNTVKIPTYVKDFIPTLLLWSFTALMPVSAGLGFGTDQKRTIQS